MNDSPRRVLFLSPFFHPEAISTGRYNTHLARALAARGCAVEVVASHPLYPDWRPVFSDATLPGIRIHRGGLRLRYPRANLPRRAVLEGWYFTHVLRQVRRLRSDVHGVVAVLPPMLFMPALRSMLPGVPMVGVVHDIQGIMARSADSRVRRGAAVVIRALERRAFRACDQLIALSRAMAGQLTEACGIPQARIRVHYPFVTTPPGDEAGTALQALMPPDRRHVVYAGALGEKQRPFELLAFFQALCKLRPDVTCHVFSSGPLHEAIRRRNESGGSPAIHFHGLVPDEQLPELYARSTVQVIPQAEGTGAGAFPSKLPNLLQAGVPVFAICDAASELARVLDETGAGMHVGGDDPHAWASSMAALLSRLEGEDRDARRARLSEYVARHFNIEHLVDDILACFPHPAGLEGGRERR
ncbi:MAG TPA: glycosyltransferase WbuB [Gammaproteobacteria bacterium]|nr:glycosyltransferase WbuB [Gammaproteobacteria bacterium]